ncbi:MAG TPA: hypothetical protein VGD98_18240 [Ktedonobacteraceae bacterium]
MIHPQDTSNQSPPTGPLPRLQARRRKIPPQLKIVGALSLLICLLAIGFLFFENGRGVPDASQSNNTITPVLAKPWCAAPGALVNDFSGTGFSGLGLNDVWSVGPKITHWDGKNWAVSYTPVSPQDSLRSIVEIAPGDVWAVGEHQLAGMASQTLLLHWDGTHWQKVSAPEAAAGGKNSLVALSGSATNDIWAVGFSVPLQGPIAPLIEHWNGTKWSMVHLSSSSSLQFASVKALTQKNAWAVGYEYSTRAGKSVVKPVTEHWNGTKWSALTNPDLSANGGGNLYNIGGDTANDLWAVGSQNNGSQLLAEHWDGSKWSLVVSPSVAPGNGNWLAGVVVGAPDNVWAVGRISGQSGFQPFIEHWNGQEWEVLQDPTGNAGELDFIAGIGSQLWVIGLPQVSGGHAFIETLCP